MSDHTTVFHPSTSNRGARLIWPQGTKLELGMSIRDALEQIREFKPESPIEIICDNQNPAVVDVVIDLSTDGLRLRFDPIFQRLRLIDIYDLSILTLVHNGSAAFSGKAIPSFECVYQIFGPTYPGRLEKHNEVSSFVLQYPGLCFKFPVTQEMEHLYRQKDVAFNMPTNSSPATRMFIFFGEDLGLSELPPVHQRGLGYMEPVQISLTTNNPSITFKRNDMGGGETKGGEPIIRLRESSPQDVVSVLGPPQSVFHKMDEFSETKATDYFYNYPEAGMDIQFNGQAHRVIKIHLTANLPGHPNFLEYDRCCFVFGDFDLGSDLGSSKAPSPTEKAPTVEVETPCADNSSALASQPEAVVGEDVVSQGGQGGKNKKKKKVKGTQSQPIEEITEQKEVSTPISDSIPPVPTPSIAPPPPLPSSNSSSALAVTALSSGSLSIDSHLASFNSPWSQLEAQILNHTDGPTKFQPVVHNNGTQNPFESTEIYCGEPRCRALFEVARSGYLCGVTLY
mmetsp:Transcript_140/g.151  ORF Transcript_140/g.151 Transcript_140/m.151 type:complete len:510 (+) Transcript_140:58-1587(+)